MKASGPDGPTAAKEAWNAAAGAWDARFDWYARSIRPLTKWFCSSVARPGARVLDIACGTGLPALTIAEAVGPRGRVVATDIAPAMVEVTRRRAREAALENVEALEMDARELRFGDGSFDAVTCACGLMFCPEPARVIGEMRRVLVPGGRVAIAVWDEPSRNPFFTIASRAVGSVLRLPPADPTAPGPFRLGVPGELQRILGEGGFVEIDVARLAMKFELESADAYWLTFTQLAAGLAERIARLSAEDRARARRTLHVASRDFVAAGRLRMTATALCALGRR